MNTYLKRLNQIADDGHKRIDEASDYHYSDSKKNKSHQAKVGEPRGMREVQFGTTLIHRGILLSRILT